MSKYLFTSVCALAAAGTALAVCLAPSRATKQQKANFVGVNYAHRGLHSKDKSVPENSLEAFRLAAEAGYGIELDVQLSKDGQVVVFHDKTLERACGVKARVGEMDYAELKQQKLFGTENTIPLFSEVLKLVDGRSTLVVELKYYERIEELCEKTYALLSAYKGLYCIESFNPKIVSWFRRNAKSVVRGMLYAPADTYEGVSPWNRFLLGKCLYNFLARPHFIAYKICKLPLSVRLCHLMGAMNIGWTSHDVINERNYDALIFEFYKPNKTY